MKTVLAAIGLLSLSACTTMQSADVAPAAPSQATGQAQAAAAEQAPLRITGSLNYYHRIAIPMDAAASISLYEAGLGVPVIEPVASQTFALNGRQVPIPFEVVIADPGALSSKELELVAVITGPAGEALWETEEQGVRFELDRPEIGLVELKPTFRSVIGIDQLTGHEWMLSSLKGEAPVARSAATINFSEGGLITGHASCNAYTGSYKVNAGKLTVGPLALTRKACMPQLMAQEQAFIEVLESAKLMQLDDDGVLTLETGDGDTLVMR